MEQHIFRIARAGGIDTNPNLFIQRAAAFSSAATENGSATLLTRRSGTDMNGYLICSGAPGDMNAAIQLAQTVGARAETAELPDDLGETPVIGTLVYRPSPAMRETQSGIDPTELPRLLATAMPAGSWVSVTMRKPVNKERRWYTTWLANRLGTAVPTHHSVHPSAVAVTITAGGATRADVSALLHQVTAGMPGFDLDSDVIFPARFHTAAAGLPAGLILAAGTLLGTPYLPPAIAETISSISLQLFLLAAAIAVPGVLALLGKIKSPDAKLRARLGKGMFRIPAVRGRRPAAPRKERIVRGSRTVNDVKVPYERVIPASDGDYPMHRTVFLLGPSVVVGMVSPNAGAVSGEKVTLSRSVPPAMGIPVGPMLGHESGNPAYLSARDAFAGTAVLGVPNSGKSLLIRSIFGWHCLERVAPSGQKGYPGANTTLIAFESKGDGVDKYKGWASTMGDTAISIDVADPASAAIDLFAVPGDISQRASFFVNAMVYAFGEQAIGDRSFATLSAVLTAGLAVTDELIDSMTLTEEASHIIVPGESPLYYGHVLLGAYSDQTSMDLYLGLKGAMTLARSKHQPNPNLELAVMAIAFLFEGKSESARRTFVEAPRSKTAQLLAIGSWWLPTRRRTTWDSILDQHLSVVINTGSSPSGRMLDDNANQQISSMLMFSMQNAVKRVCSGWQEANRNVAIFADELSLLAGNSPEVLGWLRDQGRSFGIRAFLATQRPEQLPPLLRNNLLSYGTLVSFAQIDAATAREVAGAMGEEWTQDDIQHLEPFHVLVRSHVEQRRQSAFIVKLPNFEADMPGYPAAQGYELPAARAHKQLTSFQAVDLARAAIAEDEPAPIQAPLYGSIPGVPVNAPSSIYDRQDYPTQAPPAAAAPIREPARPIAPAAPAPVQNHYPDIEDVEDFVPPAPLPVFQYEDNDFGDAPAVPPRPQVQQPAPPVQQQAPAAAPAAPARPAHFPVPPAMKPKPARPASIGFDDDDLFP